MKKNILLLLLLSLVIPFGGYACAENASHKKKLMIHIDTGYSSSLNAKGTYEDDFGGSLVLGAGVKVEIMPKIKMGVSLAHRDGFKYDRRIHADDLQKDYIQTLTVTTLMYNVSYDLYKVQDIFTPFIEGGVGVSMIRASNLTYIIQRNYPRSSTHSFDGGGVKYKPAWNIGGGVLVDLIKNTAVSVAYKYNHLGENLSQGPIEPESFKGNIKAHEFLASLYFTF